MSKIRNKVTMNIILALLASFACVGNVNAAEHENYFGIEMNNEEYYTLLNLGFTEDEIYYMNEQTFLENKDLDANLVSETTKYYKTIYNDLSGNPYNIEVTKEEYENQPTKDARATVTTTYKQMISTISQNGNKFRFKVSLMWRNMPQIRSYDIIGVGFDDDVYIDSSVYFNYHWCNSSNTCSTDSYYYDKKSTSTGGTAVFDFPDSAMSMSVTLYYDVSKNTSSTLTSLEMCGDYSHATSNVTVNTAANHDIGIAGIELKSGSVTKYDTIPCALSTWTGSW